MHPISVLIIDDESAVRKAIKTVLQKEHMQVVPVDSATSALSLLKDQSFDIILLDIMMPDQDGFSFLRSLRNLQIFTPVILLSGRVEDSMQVEGLGLGADDYMTKPFNKSVLISKIHALLRRATQYATSSDTVSTIVQKGSFSLHVDSQTVYKGTEAIPLTSREFSLLYLFLDRPEYIFTKEELFSHIWKSPDTDNNTILVYIKRLRNKIEDNPSKPLHIRTVWGTGYQFFL